MAESSDESEDRMDETLEPRLVAIERDIDTIQNRLLHVDAPWYRNSSVWISVIALLFSFGTTYVSYKRSDAQDLQAARQELRGILQRLAALPKEGLEASRKYAGDPGAAQLVGGFINQENAMLAREAAEIAGKLPKDAVSPTEYYAVALSLQNAYELSPAIDFLKRSLALAEDRSDFNSEIGALRSLGNLDFLTGKPDDGRVVYQRARAIFSRYPGFDQYTQTSTNVWTELAWASSEAVTRSPVLVRQHLDTATSLLSDLATSPGRSALDAQIEQAKAQFASMGVVSSPTPPALTTPQ
jgi:hypothetical protein